MIFDVLVLGCGPAAMAATVYLARQKRSFVVLAKQVGGQMTWSSDVENYLGFHLLDGVELTKRFQAHLEDYREAFTLREGVVVTRIEKIPGGFRAVLETGETYEGKTVLVATGAQHRALHVPGEQELYGRGVTYCAACDAPLYRDKVVFVIGGGNSAMDAALFCAKYAKRVTLITINPQIQGDAMMRKYVLASSNISVEPLTRVVAVLGEKTLTGIKLADAFGHERIEMGDGVCIEIGLVPSSQMVDFVAKDTRGQIIVDKNNATNVAGVWAAGDVTDVMQKQIAVAVGEGAKAALSLVHYFQTT